MLNHPRPEPMFKFELPKNKNISSIKRLSNEYKLIYDIYYDKLTGKEMVGLWEKVNLD